MKVKVSELNGRWFLSRVETPSRAFLIETSDKGKLRLLAFLGLATFEPGQLVPQLKEGEYEL